MIIKSIDLQNDVIPPIRPVLEIACPFGCWNEFEKSGENALFRDRLISYYKNMSVFVNKKP